MTLLQSIDGKYYDVPEDRASSYEIPASTARDALAEMGHRPGPSRPPGPASSPVVIQVLPNGVQGPASGAPSAAPAGEVDPYWYYYYWWRNWTNYW